MKKKILSYLAIIGCCLGILSLAAVSASDVYTRNQTTMAEDNLSPTEIHEKRALAITIDPSEDEWEYELGEAVSPEE